MLGFLCSEFLDFVGGRCGVTPDILGVPACSWDTCPGPDHVRTWADLVATESGVPASALLCRFGAALFGRLIRGYPAFFVGIDSTCELMALYETQIGAEVRKLDDAARPPYLMLRRPDGEPAEVVYRSQRGLADLAEGLLRGSIAHFGEPLDVERSRAASDGATQAVFRLVPRAVRR